MLMGIVALHPSYIATKNECAMNLFPPQNNAEDEKIPQN